MIGEFCICFLILFREIVIKERLVYIFELILEKRIFKFWKCIFKYFEFNYVAINVGIR